MIYQLFGILTIFYLLFWVYFIGVKLGAINQSDAAYRPSLKFIIVTNIILIIIGIFWTGYIGSLAQRWIRVFGWAFSTYLTVSRLKNNT